MAKFIKFNVVNSAAASPLGPRESILVNIEDITTVAATGATGANAKTVVVGLTGRAAQAAGLNEIPSYIRKANDKQLLEMALVENVQRQDLHPIEISTSYKRLIEECELTHEQISKIVGQSRSSITNSLRLLDLPEEIKIELAKRTLSKGHAKALLAISSNPERQILIMNLAISQKFSVREVEALCQKDGGKSRLQKKPNNRIRALCEDEIQALDDLRLRFGAKIKLKPITVEKSDTSGRIELHYNNIEDLERLLDKLKR